MGDGAVGVMCGAVLSLIGADMALGRRGDAALYGIAIALSYQACWAGLGTRYFLRAAGLGPLPGERHPSGSANVRGASRSVGAGLALLEAGVVALCLWGFHKGPRPLSAGVSAALVISLFIVGAVSRPTKYCWPGRAARMSAAGLLVCALGLSYMAIVGCARGICHVPWAGALTCLAYIGGSWGMWLNSANSGRASLYDTADVLGFAALGIGPGAGVLLISPLGPDGWWVLPVIQGFAGIGVANLGLGTYLAARLGRPSQCSHGVATIVIFSSAAGVVAFCLVEVFSGAILSYWLWLGLVSAGICAYLWARFRTRSPDVMAPSLGQGALAFGTDAAC